MCMKDAYDLIPYHYQECSSFQTKYSVFTCFAVHLTYGLRKNLSIFILFIYDSPKRLQQNLMCSIRKVRVHFKVEF